MLCRLHRKTIGLNDISLMEDRSRETLNGDIPPSLSIQKSRNQFDRIHSHSYTNYGAVLSDMEHVRRSYRIPSQVFYVTKMTFFL